MALKVFSPRLHYLAYFIVAFAYLEVILFFFFP